MQLQLTAADHRTTFDIDAAIVDLDGTMVDTIGDFAEAIARMLADLQLPAVPASAIALMVGKGTENLLRSVLTHTQRTLGVAEADIPAIVLEKFPHALERYEHHYIAINGQFSAVFPGVQEGLRALQSAGVRLACVTNKPMSFTVPLLAAKGLDDLFEHVFGGDSFAKKKPDPLPLLKTCEALGTAPARTLMLGDSSNDAQAGRAAGCPVALVTYGYNHGEPIHGVDADGFVDSMVELRASALA